jgi:hypothetical protein
MTETAVVADDKNDHKRLPGGNINDPNHPPTEREPDTQSHHQEVLQVETAAETPAAVDDADAMDVVVAEPADDDEDVVAEPVDDEDEETEEEEDNGEIEEAAAPVNNAMTQKSPSSTTAAAPVPAAPAAAVYGGTRQRAMSTGGAEEEEEEEVAAVVAEDANMAKEAAPSVADTDDAAVDDTDDGAAENSTLERLARDALGDLAGLTTTREVKEPAVLAVTTTTTTKISETGPSFGSSFLSETLTEEERRTRTRYLPQVDGMHALRKGEVKSDLALARLITSSSGVNTSLLASNKSNKSTKSQQAPQRSNSALSKDSDMGGGGTDEAVAADQQQQQPYSEDDRASSTTDATGTAASSSFSRSRTIDFGATGHLTLPSAAFVAPTDTKGNKQSAATTPKEVEAMTAFNPPRPPESVGPKKKHRLLRWERRPSDIEGTQQPTWYFSLLFIPSISSSILTTTRHFAILTFFLVSLKQWTLGITAKRFKRLGKNYEVPNWNATGLKQWTITCVSIISIIWHVSMKKWSNCRKNLSRCSRNVSLPPICSLLEHVVAVWLARIAPMSCEMY